MDRNAEPTRWYVGVVEESVGEERSGEEKGRCDKREGSSEVCAAGGRRERDVERSKEFFLKIFMSAMSFGYKRLLQVDAWCGWTWGSRFLEN